MRIFQNNFHFNFQSVFHHNRESSGWRINVIHAPLNSVWNDATSSYLLFLNAFRSLQYRFFSWSRSKLNVDRVTVYICFSNNRRRIFLSFLFLSLVLIECSVKKIIITRVFDFLKKLYFIYFHTWNNWNWKRACPLSLWSFKYIINIYYYFSLQNLILEAMKQWSIRLDFIFSFAKDTKYHICTSNKIFHS